MSNVVLTCWLRGPDPQRDGAIDGRAVAEITANLRDSITGGELIVVEAEPVRGVYLDRWVLAADWLQAHREVSRVWCVDAGDVVMLREPWAAMLAGRLYVGSEPSALTGNPWMLANHPAPFLQAFIASQPGPLLNAGLLGGDRATVLEFLLGMVELIDTHGDTLGLDMGPFNWLAYNRFAERTVTGEQVHTEFKAERDNGKAWWKHK